MSEIADFSKLTIDVLRLVERFTYLTKSNRFNLPNLINLIELMNKAPVILFFDHSKSMRRIPWRYKELNFDSVEFIRDRIQARCDIMAYKDEDIQNCHLMVGVKY